MARVRYIILFTGQSYYTGNWFAVLAQYDFPIVSFPGSTKFVLFGNPLYGLTLQSGINVGPTFINFGFFSRPYSLIKGPTFIKFWNFYQGLQKFSSLMGFLLHKFAHFVHALRLFKALRLFFLTNFPGPTVIPCPTSIPDSRVYISLFKFHT